eukprot:366281-Chlamydomonas_euryale.AAC.12
MHQRVHAPLRYAPIRPMRLPTHSSKARALMRTLVMRLTPQLAFWAVALPGAYFGYHQTTGEWLSLDTDRAQLLGLAAAFVTGVRFAGACYDGPHMHTTTAHAATRSCLCCGGVHVGVSEWALLEGGHGSGLCSSCVFLCGRGRDI